MNMKAVSSYSDIFLSELDIKQKPKPKDIAETIALLQDFHINAIVPSFLTLSQLLRWRSDQIDKTELARWCNSVF